MTDTRADVAKEVEAMACRIAEKVFISSVYRESCVNAIAPILTDFAARERLAGAEAASVAAAQRMECGHVKADWVPGTCNQRVEKWNCVRPATHRGDCSPFIIDTINADEPMAGYCRTCVEIAAAALEMREQAAKIFDEQAASMVHSQLREFIEQSARMIRNLPLPAHSQAALEQHDRCQGCGGPHSFDTSVPSDKWNAVIRVKGLPEFLCLTCIVREFVKARKDFTAELWGETFNGTPIAICMSLDRLLAEARAQAYERVYTKLFDHITPTAYQTLRQWKLEAESGRD